MAAKISSKNKKHSPSQSCQKEKEKHEIDNLLELKLPDWSRLKSGNLVDCQNSVWKCLEEVIHSVLVFAK